MALHCDMFGHETNLTREEVKEYWRKIREWLEQGCPECSKPVFVE